MRAVEIYETLMLIWRRQDVQTECPLSILPASWGQMKLVVVVVVGGGGWVHSVYTRLGILCTYSILYILNYTV